jgi:glycerol-3-phosphate dehydrogenase
MKPAPPPPRAAPLARLASAELDVLVVGGGIVGSGVARDAAMRGLRTGLVEQHDFAFGTSSRSSRLLHGGLRYLEQGRVGLVREASVEKKVVQRLAPHLAAPLGFVFPSYRGRGRPLWQLRVGVKLYDLLCGGRNFAPSRGLTAEETAAALPGLDAAGLRGAVRYFDALTNDARLVIDTLRSAARHGATVANYVRFLEAEREGGGWRCRLEDGLTGESLSLRTRAVVNATGPWAEGLPHSAVKLRLSKGIHLVIDRSRLPVRDAAVLAEGKRILFVLPWGERVILGTTDTDYAGAPEAVVVLPEDVQYVLRAVNEAFPRVALTRADIVSSWAGLRPLVAQADGSPSDISRAHEIRESRPGWWDVTGGKLTTYRLMAEQTVDRLARQLDHAAEKSRTAREPLLPPGETACSGIGPAPFTAEAVEHYLRHEWAQTLEDVMIRRSGWHYYWRDAGAKAETVAGWMAAVLGWTPAQTAAALSRYRAQLQVAA